MANFTNPHGGAYGLKDPFLHEELNLLIDQLLQAPNFDEGSSHAPTGDIALSGTFGHGFVFAEMFPFAGELDVSDGLILDAPTSGFLSVKAHVAVDLFGAITFKSTSTTLHAGSSVETYQSGSTVTFASGSTLQLSGAVNVRGTVTYKSTANGGPGILNFETTSQLNFGVNAIALISTNDWTWNGTAVQTYVAGAQVAGVYTRTGRTTWSGTGARQQYRPSVTLSASADEDVTIESDRYQVPLTLTGNRLYTLRHTAPYAPNNGERIKVYRTGPTTPSAHSAKFQNESGTILWSFYNSRQGFAEFEFKGGAWVLVAGVQVESVASGYYDDTW